MRPFPDWGSDDGAVRQAFEAECQRNCRSVYVGDKTVLAKVLGKYYMYLQSDDAGISSNLMFGGHWESWLTIGLRSCLRSGMKVADVGANHGYYTLVMADAVGPDGHVHAFEPQPQLCELLRRTLYANGLEQRATVRQAAVGNSEGEVVLSIPTTTSAAATILNPEETVLADSIKFQINVPVVSLDSLFRQQPLDLVRIDAEGAEAMIVTGMDELLFRQPVVQIAMELHPQPPAQRRMLDRLEEAGYEPFAINYSGELCRVPFAYVRSCDFDPMLILQKGSV